MSKYQFSVIERQTLFEAYKRKCFYCDTLMSFKELEIDHILPEHLLFKKNFKEVLKKHGLPESWQINSYANWIPCHRNCNSRKGKTLFSPNQSIFYIELASRRLEKINSIENKLKRKIMKDAFSDPSVIKRAKWGLIAAKVANYVYDFHFESHRGAIPFETGITAVFGNDGYEVQNDDRSKNEVLKLQTLLRKRKIKQLGFGLSKDKYSWCMLVKTNDATLVGKRIWHFYSTDNSYNNIQKRISDHDLFRYQHGGFGQYIIC